MIARVRAAVIRSSFIGVSCAARTLHRAMQGPAHILLVDDDHDLRLALAKALARDGHEVDTAADGAGAIEALAAAAHDLLLLDVMLGAGVDGIEVCRRVRHADPNMYVMILTGHTAEADAVLALEAGADDYLIKPVGLAELRHRVRAALHRTRRRAPKVHAPGDVLRHRTLVIDEAASAIRVGDVPLELTPSERRVLTALVRAGGAVRSRGQLLRAIFGDDDHRDRRTVDVHVHHLRDKLARAGGDADWIVTVRGSGYRLASQE
jgi:DNA-binding response OmpR family regulator